MKLSKILFLIAVGGALWSCSDAPVERTAEDNVAIQALRDKGIVILDFFDPEVTLHSPISEDSKLVMYEIPAEGGECTIPYSYYGIVSRWFSNHAWFEEFGFVCRADKERGDHEQWNMPVHDAIKDYNGIWAFRPYSYKGDYYYLDASNLDCIKVTLDENDSGDDRVIWGQVTVGYRTSNYYKMELRYLYPQVFEFEKTNRFVVQQPAKGREPLPEVREFFEYHAQNL